LKPRGGGALLEPCSGRQRRRNRLSQDPSFITTLAGLIAFRGLALLFNNGSPIFSLDPRLEPIFYGSLFGIPMPLFYIVVLYAGAAFS
jgi:ribose transport system permease protein